MKKLVTVLSVALLGAVIGAVYLWQELDDLRNGNAALLTRVDALGTRPQSDARVTAPVPVADTTAAPASTASLPAAKAVLEDPALRDLTRTVLRNMLGQQFPDLAQELGLSPAELDKFLDLLADQRTNNASGSSPEKTKADEAAVAALLGGSRYAQWQEYQQTLPARQQVSQLRGQLAASGSTLADAQARPLMAALSAEQKRINQDLAREQRPATKNPQEMQEQSMQRVADSNHRLVEAAKPYLNAQQLDSYRQMLDRQIEMGRMLMKSVNAVQEQAGTRN